MTNALLGASEQGGEGSQREGERTDRGEGRRERGEDRRERADRGDSRRERSPQRETGRAPDDARIETANDHAAAAGGTAPVSHSDAPAPQNDTGAADQHPNRPAQEGGERRERRSRDRYGRDRRERAPQGPLGVGSQLPLQNFGPTDDSDQPVPLSVHTSADDARAGAQDRAGESAPVRSYFDRVNQSAAEQAAAPSAISPPEHALPPATQAPKPHMRDQAHSEPPTVPAAPTPTEPLAVAAAPTRQPVPPPAIAVAGMPKVGSYALPVSDLDQLAQQCGLQWVRSDTDRIAAAQAAIAAEVKPIHVPRERVPPVALDVGPLVLVETRRDLRDLKLPFEA